MLKQVKVIIYVIILILLLFWAFFIFNRLQTTGLVTQNLKESYTYTKAICNSENECLDVIITCNEGRVKKIEPASKIVKHDFDWIDPRPENTGYC